MTHIKNEFEISQAFIASTTSDDLKIHLEAKITQEIVSRMLDSIQSGSYVSIEPHDEGYTMGIDLLMIDNNELQDAIGTVIGRMFECIPIYEMGAELAQFIMAPLTFSAEEIEKECQAPFIKRMVARDLSNLAGFSNFLASIELGKETVIGRLHDDSVDAIARTNGVQASVTTFPPPPPPSPLEALRPSMVIMDDPMRDEESQRESINTEGEEDGTSE